MSTYELAQFNIAVLRYERDAAELQGYRDFLAQVTPVALGWSGFVWIMDDQTLIEQAEHHYGELAAANLSVWTRLDTLGMFMNCPEHRAASVQGSVGSNRR